MKKFILLGPIIVLILWQIVSMLGLIDPFFLPGPIDTFKEMIIMFGSGTVFYDILATLWRTILAFSIAVIIGLPIGLLLGESEKIYRSLEFVIDFFRSLPPLAVFPLFLLIFGITDTSKVAVTVFGSALIIIFNTSYGVINAKKVRILAAKVMGATKGQIFKWIIFWECLPQTFIGLRSAISFSLLAIIVTEMFIGTKMGLGKLIVDSQLVYNIKAMYAAIILAGVLGYLLNHLLLFIEKKYIHWSSR
jgi:NitT/TauT family transport system permease protein